MSNSVTDEPASAADDGGPSVKSPRDWKQFTVGREISLTEVMEFSRQLSSFLEAGIPMIDALETVGLQMETPQMAAVVDQIKATVQRGSGFTEAINEHPKVFPAYYRAIVRSADFTGRLDKVLAQLTSYLERDMAARRQLRSAPTYPIMVLVVATIAVIAMTLFVLPKFSDLYRGLGAKLPLPTRMLLGFTDFVGDFWWAILLAVIVGIGVGIALLGGAKGKPRRDQLLLRTPIIGSLVRVIAVERFTRVLSALSEAGVPLPDGINVASDATNNTIFQDAIADVREVLVRGGGLSQPLEDSGAFPLPALQMVRVGEKTGTLSTQLSKTAAYYEREVNFRLKKAADLFQPIVILGVGIVVGFVAIAQVAAMYSVFSQVK